MFIYTVKSSENALTYMLSIGLQVIEVKAKTPWEMWMLGWGQQISCFTVKTTTFF